VFEISEELNEQSWQFLTNALWIKFFRTAEPEEGEESAVEIDILVGTEERRFRVLGVYREKIDRTRRVEDDVKRRWLQKVERAVRV